ncbi:hypothetical protein P378_05570 [Desulforamulus profundi]|uniref:Uncharacterized protein n=2 Tax=Desulforamulus TaxID=2916693 RepID=A0A2C6MCU0_9FIRM|nr:MULTISPECIES: hypothetical protein [Desulforamulus]PHJ39069.1 hypothetical protein P378_05570 [Desulforamulus profundi]SHE68337.1 hypothetical protein SAMN02745133_00931 [Desulforamulus putei DSM 12395]
MKKAFLVIWGLLIDDLRLALGTILSVIACYLLNLKYDLGEYGGWLLLSLIILSVFWSLSAESRKYKKRNKIERGTPGVHS